MTAVNQHPNPTLTVGDSGGVTLDAKDVQHLRCQSWTLPVSDCAPFANENARLISILRPLQAIGGNRTFYSVDSSFKEVQNSIRMDKSEPPWPCARAAGEWLLPVKE